MTRTKMENRLMIPLSEKLKSSSYDSSVRFIVVSKISGVHLLPMAIEIGFQNVSMIREMINQGRYAVVPVIISTKFEFIRVYGSLELSSLGQRMHIMCDIILLIKMVIQIMKNSTTHKDGLQGFQIMVPRLVLNAGKSLLQNSK